MMIRLTMNSPIIIINTALLVNDLDWMFGSGMWCLLWNLWHSLGSLLNEAQMASKTLSGVRRPLKVIPLITILG